MKKLRLMKNVAMHVFLSDYIKRWWSLWTETKALSLYPDFIIISRSFPHYFFFEEDTGKNADSLTLTQ